MPRLKKVAVWAGLGVINTPVALDAMPPSFGLMGPPYRWLQVDCECYFRENLYVKEAAGERIDAYFNLQSLNDSDEEFWAQNRSTFSEDVRRDILRQVRMEAARRRDIPVVYHRNATHIRFRYRPRFPQLFQSLPLVDLEPPEVAPGLPAHEVFAPAFLDMWRSAVRGDGLSGCVKHVHLECFEQLALTPSFCEMLVEELAHFEAADLPHQSPNTMNRSGVVLNEIGLGPLMDRVIEIFFLPVCRSLYPHLLGGGLSAHHSFVTKYAMGQDTSLGVHDDNSEVTVNIALLQDFEGASLALYHHARVAHPQREEKQSFQWRVSSRGTMLLHPGEMLHEVLPLTAGQRMGLIIWMRCDAYREEHGCPLCGQKDQFIRLHPRAPLSPSAISNVG